MYIYMRLVHSKTCRFVVFFFFQAEDGIRDRVRSRGLGDVYKRQVPRLPKSCSERNIIKILLFCPDALTTIA